MKSKVYLVGVDRSDTLPAIRDKFRHLLEKTQLLDFVSSGDRVAIKIHFGEDGNTGFVRPEYTRVVSDIIIAKQATPFLADANTLYRGRRTDSSEHLKIAYEHGFRPEIVAAEVIIPDDRQEGNVATLRINQKFIQSAKIAKIFLEADALVDIAHFKGHLMTGFGGALKNIGMGCASREGKLAQHCDISPLIILSKCRGCGECVKSCPAEAIMIKDKKAYIDELKCIGCASCIAACKQNAAEVNWEAGGDNIQEKMVEYAKAIIDSKKGKIAYINFALKITKECDCLAKDDPRIVADIGILVSRDPVSIDKASMDLVNQASGRDILKELHPKRDGFKQLQYAAQLGLGSLDYELINLA
jgi:hypothetical protein